MIEIAAFAYLSAVSGYSLAFSLAGIFYKRRTGNLTQKPCNKYHKIAVLIPAYKEDGVIVSVAQEALRQNYPSEKYDVIIIADSLQQKTLENLGRLSLKLMKVQFKNSTKVKALQAALSRLSMDYEVAVILDADNIMENNFLQKINHEFNRGGSVIQARRIAKNINTSFAILDAFSEMINNHIFRKGSQVLGLSSPLTGSGMAFSYMLLKEVLESIKAVGGFDRELQVKIVGRGHYIRYLHDAVVLDEKVAKSAVYGNQRRRWLSSQFFYIRRFFKKGFLALWKGNFDLFNISILNNIQLPRILNLGFLLLLTGFSVLFSEFASISAFYWLTLLGMNIIAMLLAVPLKFYNKRFFVALLSAPRAFFIMCRSLLRLKGANRKFIHTPHAS